jgi:hypothetical protein
MIAQGDESLYKRVAPLLDVMGKVDISNQQHKHLNWYLMLIRYLLFLTLKPVKILSWGCRERRNNEARG